MQRYRQYGSSYSSSSPSSVPVEEVHTAEEEEEVYTEEEVYEEEAEPLIQEDMEPVVQETGRIRVWPVDLVWFGLVLIWPGLVWFG